MRKHFYPTQSGALRSPSEPTSDIAIAVTISGGCFHPWKLAVLAHATIVIFRGAIKRIAPPRGKYIPRLVERVRAAQKRLRTGDRLAASTVRELALTRYKTVLFALCSPRSVRDHVQPIRLTLLPPSPRKVSTKCFYTLVVIRLRFTTSKSPT